MTRGEPRGVSLLELVVALAVTAMLAALMLVVIINVTDHWRRRTDRQSATSQIAFALDQLEADLRGAMISGAGVTTFIASIQPDQTESGGHAGMSGEAWLDGSPGRRKPGAAQGSLLIPAATATEPIPPLVRYRFGQAGTWLRFANFAIDRDPGAPARRETLPVVVAYQLVRRAHALGRRAEYQLFRSQVAAEATLLAGSDLLAPAYVLPDNHVGSPGNVRRPAARDLLADGVVDFGLRVLERMPDDTLVLRFPTSVALETRIDASPQGRLIFEVFIRVLTEDGRRRLATFEYSSNDYAQAEDWWTLVEANSLVFTRTITPVGRGL